MMSLVVSVNTVYRQWRWILWMANIKVMNMKVF